LTAQFPTVVARLDALIALARVRRISSARVNKLNTFREQAMRLCHERNRIVHDPWFYAFETKKHYRLQKTAKAKLDYAYKPVTEEELNSMEAKIGTMRERFREVGNEILHAYWSSP
jgi:hypothetical protein